jgi:hypothetical protein
LLCNFLHSPITSSLFGPNILLSTLFSNTLSMLVATYQIILHHMPEDCDFNTAVRTSISHILPCSKICISSEGEWYM